MHNYMYMYVCIYIYICMYKHIYIYMYVYICMYVCICIHCLSRNVSKSMAKGHGKEIMFRPDLDGPPLKRMLYPL